MSDNRRLNRAKKGTSCPRKRWKAHGEHHLCNQNSISKTAFSSSSLSSTSSSSLSPEDLDAMFQAEVTPLPQRERDEEHARSLELATQVIKR